MEVDGVDDVIDEAAIKKVMEDVGLRPVDLNSEDSEPVDDVTSSCETSIATTGDTIQQKMNGDDTTYHTDVPCLTTETHPESADDDGEEEDDNMPEEGEHTSEEDEPLARTAEKAVALKDKHDKFPLTEGSEDQTEENLNATTEMEIQNLNGKLQDTPAAVRRSGRTKLPNSPNANETQSLGRTTRSQINPDILAKQKSFMQKYHMAVKSSMDSYVRSAASETESKSEHQPAKRKWEDTGGTDTLQSPYASPVQEKKCKKSIINTPAPKVVCPIELTAKTVARHDTFCWICHSDGQIQECIECPRVFHPKCVQLQSPIPPNWVCTECVSVRNAEKHNRIDIDQLPVMLNFAMERIKSVADAQPFFKPVDTEEFPHYTEYVVFPVDISQLEDKISQGLYTSTRAFLADFRWILHNCIIFNSFHSKLTSIARTLMKVCKHEMAEIDTCADCYVHAHTKRETWFLEPCRRPHLLLWAKLKGFPHWPAKAMKANKEGNVDVRFFGAHDRAWVPAKDCFLYSREMPINLKNQRKANLLVSIEEVDLHIKKLIERYGSFAYPSPRTAYNPLKEEEQLQLLIPGYKVSEDSQNSSLMGESGEAESMHSDSDAEVAGEIEPDKPKDAVPDVDRTEGRNFLAMLQLAPRSSTETIPPINNNRSTSPPPSPIPSLATSNVTELQTNVPVVTHSVTAKLQGKNNKVDRSSNIKQVCADVSIELPPNISTNLNESSCEVVKTTKVRAVSPSRRSSTSKEVIPIKTEPVDYEEEDELLSGSQGSKNCSISLAINKVIGNYKPSPGLKSKSETTSKSTPKSGTAKATSSKPGVKTPNQKSTPKSSSKAITNRVPGSKTLSASKINAKPLQTIRRQIGNEEEDLDPAMYLDPTITITLINNEEKEKAINKTVSEMVSVTSVSSISSSDLQALNALGENVSITVVPKRKAVSNAMMSASSKENEVVDQPMVIEVDPASLQKSRALGQQTPKARKSFPKTRTGVQPAGSQKSLQKQSVPPMVSIPSRHLGMEISRPPAVSKQSTSSRVPSITVRPVTQLVAPQPSIILQSSSSDTIKQSTLSSTTSTTSSGNSTTNTPLTLNTVHTLGQDFGFASGGLLLTFNRSLPAFTATSTSTSAIATQSKSDIGSLTAHLSSRTNQIVDMVQNTIETLIQEMSNAGNAEATIVHLQLDLERCRSLHQQEVGKLRKALETQQTIAESEKQQALSDLRRQMEAEKQRAIDEIKKKQWCAHCSQEAIFYCCWNTAYCDYPCQQAHWPKHMTSCANANQNTEVESNEAEGSYSPSDSPVQAQTPPKSIPTVHGSPGHGKKSFLAKANIDSPKELGNSVINSSDISIPLAASPVNGSVNHEEQFDAETVLMSPTEAPIDLVQSTPVETVLHISEAPGVLPAVKSLQSEEACEEVNE